MEHRRSRVFRLGIDASLFSYTGHRPSRKKHAQTVLLGSCFSRCFRSAHADQFQCARAPIGEDFESNDYVGATSTRSTHEGWGPKAENRPRVQSDKPRIQRVYCGTLHKQGSVHCSPGGSGQGCCGYRCPSYSAATNLRKTPKLPLLCGQPPFSNEKLGLGLQLLLAYGESCVSRRGVV